jgi:hypothetical protein
MRTTNKHFYRSLLLTCFGTISTGLLLSAPAARAGCDSPRNGTEAVNCSNQSRDRRYQDDRNRGQQWEAEQNRKRQEYYRERNNNPSYGGSNNSPSYNRQPQYQPLKPIVSLLPKLEPSPSSTELQVMFSLFDF